MSNAAESLTRVADMADALTKAVRLVEEAEAELNSAKAVLRTIEEEDFPTLLQELGLTEVKLADGRTIKLEHLLRCSISEERRAAAHAWLREHSFGGLIKTELRLPFGRDEEERMKTVETEIYKALGIVPERYEAVHPQTLGAFLREQYDKADAENTEDPNIPPREMFGVTTFDRVKVKAPKR